jgi:hypothetical protein
LKPFGLFTGIVDCVIWYSAASDCPSHFVQNCAPTSAGPVSLPRKVAP